MVFIKGLKALIWSGHQVVTSNGVKLLSIGSSPKPENGISGIGSDADDTESDCEKS